ncbi:MAG: hypothetical protein LUE23_08910 [Lachnospiraceae bacterium]|nr:hypothetical protein [Lachnospiraceae bacterium]
MVINPTEQFEIPVTDDFFTDQGRMEARERLHAKDRELTKIYNRITGPIYRIDGVRTRSTWCLATRSNDDMLTRHVVNSRTGVVDQAWFARFLPFMRARPEESDHCYISANIFVNAPFRYTHSDLFGLRNIVIDLDYHQDMANYTSREDYIADVILRANQFLPLLLAASDESAKGTVSYVPMPNLVVYTGRGLQLWYYLVPASAKLTFLWEMVARELTDRMKKLAKQVGFKVDKKASTNPAGLFRLPGSYHPGVGVYGQVITLSSAQNDLNGLKDACGIVYQAKSWRNRGSAKSTSRSTHKARQWSEDDSISLARRRCDILCRVITTREKVFSREVLLFLWHNYALQIFGGEADDLARALNERFASQKGSLSRCEVECIIRSNWRQARSEKGPYRYTDDRFFEEADLTPEETKAYKRTGARSQNSSDYVAPARRRAQAKKAAEIERIQNYYRHGRVGLYKRFPMLTIAEIARRTGKTPKTVRKYIQPIKKAIEREKKWRKLCKFVREAVVIAKKQREETLKDAKATDWEDSGKNNAYYADRDRDDVLRAIDQYCCKCRTGHRPGMEDMDNLMSFTQLLLGSRHYTAIWHMENYVRVCRRLNELGKHVGLVIAVHGALYRKLSTYPDMRLKDPAPNEYMRRKWGLDDPPEQPASVTNSGIPEGEKPEWMKEENSEIYRATQRLKELWKIA